MRELGTGHWDRKLMERMVELSVADNYEEAKEEWIATGEVWWRGNGDIPEWVSSNNHPEYCLCGHGIVYHFHILNTENGHEDIVGSDHINSYLIMRQIAQEKKVDIGTVTEEEVERWLKVRVGSMKAEAWWKVNGDSFQQMFDKVKELDCWLNTYERDWVYKHDTQWNEPIRVLRKKGKGTPFTDNYRMASIVWRWNHPDNPKNQFTVHGYPNDKLMQDLSLLFVQSDLLLEKFHAYKEKRKARVEEVARMRAEREEGRRLARIEREARMERERLEREAIQAEKLRIYNLPENVEKRRLEAERREAERLEREEHIRIANEKAEAERIRVMNLTFDSEPNEFLINNLQLAGLPMLSRRVCEDMNDLRVISSIMAALSNANKDPSDYFRNLRAIMFAYPTVEQVELIKELGLEVPKNRLEAEQLLQEREL